MAMARVNMSNQSAKLRLSIPAWNGYKLAMMAAQMFRDQQRVYGAAASKVEIINSNPRSWRDGWAAIVVVTKREGVA
jgi:hypothetical protein